MIKAAGSFDVQAWDEKPYDELEGGLKLTKATVKQRFSGDIEGDGSVEWLMFYREDGTATFVGLQRFIGSVHGRSGSFVLETSGEYDGNEARAAWSVIGGSGTEELRGLRGKGTYVAPHGSRASITLEYDFE